MSQIFENCRPVFRGLFLCTFLATTVVGADWMLNGGTGSKFEDGTLEVVGKGSGSNAWISEQIPLEAGSTYRFNMEACSPTGGGGCAPCGPEGFSRDRPDITKDWKKFSYVFRVPDNRKTNRLRVGQWESTQTFRFRNIETVPVEAIPAGVQSSVDATDYLLLGNGETILNDIYVFNGWFNGEGSNYHRTLVRQTAGFNSDRFTFGDGAEVVYRFELKPIRIDKNPSEDMSLPKPVRFLSAKVNVGINHHAKGNCVVGISKDDKDWTELGRIDATGSISEMIPESFFPAETIYVRISADKGANFQIDTIGFDAPFEQGRGFRGVGEMVFADIEPASTAQDTEVAAPEYSSKPLFFDAQRTLYVLHRNDSDVAVKPILVNPPNRMSGMYKESFYTIIGPFDAQSALMQPKSSCIETKPLPPTTDIRIPFSNRVLHYSFPYHTYRDAKFGYAVTENVWWTEPDWKVSPTQKRPPTNTAKPIRIEAAKNDFESFQLVTAPPKKAGSEVGTPAQLPASTEISLALDGDLLGNDGATITAENVQIRYAYYHFVQRPTDRTGLVGDWPDALPPLESPLKIEANRNQPFWITVYVPKDAVPGDYQGSLKLRTNDVDENIPFTVHVWNFALPERNRHETAFGISPGNIYRYHNCKTEADKRAVLELYWKNFSEHRVSVYNPTPLDPIRVKWNPKSVPPSADVDFAAFDKEMERRIREHHITNFNLHLQGMGWGTYEDRHPGKIGEFVAGTPEYEAMFSDYVKKLETHLTEKGWLDMAYIYWFDEPEPKDYEFVAECTARIQKYAPKLARMITEEPNQPFIDALEKAKTNINVWCPVSYNFNDDEVKKRQALGERFWWYVCTGPKAPFCTLFIDHPGTELRVWYWQAFQRDVVGSLVWESTYWTSSSAFPNEPQNPYDDPMGYVSSGPPGSKRYWGNGDGRFVYPPLDAATPGRNDGQPILKAPVSSIRWEMIREGIEDYEMLDMLRDLRTKYPKYAERIDNLLIIPAGISSSLTDFTKDPEPVLQRRRAVAELIEKLNTEPRP